MNAKLAILTVGALPTNDIIELMAESIDARQIKPVTLLGNYSREDALEEYGSDGYDETFVTLLAGNENIILSKPKVEQALSAIIHFLDKQGVEVILLMSSTPFSGLTTTNAMLLERDKIIPQLVASIVESHQVGLIVPIDGLLKSQQEKWQVLENTPLFTVANPLICKDDELLQAGRQLLQQGVDVIVLDCMGFRQSQRDVIQKELGIPVLLSNILLARLALELLT